MKRIGLLLVVLIAILGGGVFAAQSYIGEATIEEETPFLIPAGSSLSSVAGQLEEQGLISSADGF